MMLQKGVSHWTEPHNSVIMHAFIHESRVYQGFCQGSKPCQHPLSGPKEATMHTIKRKPHA